MFTKVLFYYILPILVREISNPTFPSEPTPNCILPTPSFPKYFAVASFEELYMFSSIHITIVLQQFVLYFLCKLKFNLNCTFLHDFTILFIFFYCYLIVFFLSFFLIIKILYIIYKSMYIVIIYFVSKIKCIIHINNSYFYSFLILFCK